MEFTKASRKKSKLRLSVTGPSGSGKTYGALLIAQGMGGRTAVIDTENGSADLYAEQFDFDSLQLAPPFSPERYIQAIKAAEAAGYDNIIIDSTSHEWSGSGGCLEINDQIAKAKFQGNTWSAWSHTTPRHQAFFNAMLQSPCHIITTARSKTETAQQEVNGKKKVVKLGLKTEQRDGFEYEWTVVLDIVHEGHIALASKDRTGLFNESEPTAITAATGKALINWLNKGDALKPKPAPAPAPSDAPQLGRDDSGDVTGTPTPLQIAARKEACKGLAAYSEYWTKALTAEQRKELKEHHPTYKQLAMDVDAEEEDNRARMAGE
jgi:hypothetical protein